MNWLKLSFYIILCVFCCTVASSEDVAKKGLCTFEKCEVGKMPKGWTVAENRSEGTPAVWKVVEMNGAPSGDKVFALTDTKNGRKVFNLAIDNEKSYEDLEIEVKVRSIVGEIDQGGGPMWRVQDKDNYYIARWNPLETNLRLYHVVDGKRTQLKTIENLDVDADKWHTIHVKHKGANIVVSFDGIPMLKAEDGTFTKAGKIGLWTKADAVTAFDDLKVVPIKE